MAAWFVTNLPVPDYHWRSRCSEHTISLCFVPALALCFVLLLQLSSDNDIKLNDVKPKAA